MHNGRYKEHYSMTNISKVILESAAKTMITHINTISETRKNSSSCIVSDKQVEMILHLNLTQQSSLIKRAGHYLKLELDKEALDKQLLEIDKRNKEREIENQFLLLGAPLILMRRLFGMHASDFSRRRNGLYIRGSGSGRPINCEERMERTLWQHWKEFDDAIDERARFLRLSELTNLDLHIIWNALRPYIDKDLPKQQ